MPTGRASRRTNAEIFTAPECRRGTIVRSFVRGAGGLICSAPDAAEGSWRAAVRLHTYIRSVDPESVRGSLSWGLLRVRLGRGEGSDDGGDLDEARGGRMK